VRRAKDIHLLRKIIAGKHPHCRIIAKVESREALTNIDEIIDASDGIMVARGDLGICVPIYKVPMIQKDIIRRCRAKKKPVVVATQMLDSMIEERTPTRAEVSDVANAILDGATHLLLSAETAVGRHPDRVVAMMNTIIKYTEQKM
jgi:pyruvate kinase